MESLIVSTLGKRESTTTSSLRKLIHRLAEEHKLNQTMINPQMGSKEGLFRVALVLHDIDSPHIHNGSSLHAISHPISTCVLTNLVVLNEKDRDIDRAVKWLERQQVPNATQLAIGWGRQGFQELLGSDAIDAVYLVVPTRLHTQYTIPALESGRHVLLNDPESTSVGDFLAQLEAAKKANKFIQFSTMFTHHYHVRTFLGQVMYAEEFGQIESIDSRLCVNYDDLARVRVSLPLRPGNGCIRRLGRFCVLVSCLMFSRLGHRPVSARITAVELDPESGQPISADCEVLFSDNRRLTFSVGYTHAHTRQILRVCAQERYATLTDFVIPHPDGLSTYRVYHKSESSVSDDRDDDLEVDKGEAVDIPSGPPHAAMMWRQFAEYSRSIDRDGWEAQGLHSKAHELTTVAMHTKQILIALDQCLEKGIGVAVPIECASV